MFGPGALRQRTAQETRSLSNLERKERAYTEERPVKIEVLYVAECRSHPAAVKLVKCVLAAQGVEAHIDEVLLSDARIASELRFRGSPSIRINGRDVTGESQEERGFALSCRLYSGSEHVDLPPAELIRRAVLEARQGDKP